MYYVDSIYAKIKTKIIKGGLLAKSRKLFFQGRSFLDGKIQKMQKKISKNFIVPNRLIGHTDPHLMYFLMTIFPRTFFPGEVIFGGQNQKKILKNFIVPKRLLGHIDHLHTYKGHLSMLVSRKNSKN